MQDSAANCGPAAMSNALQAMGTIRSQAECEVLCGTTGQDGTSPRGLVKGLISVGAQPVTIAEARADVAILRLLMGLMRGRASILCVDDDQHWVAAVGTLGDRVLIADSADNELVISLHLSTLETRWKGAGRRPFQGVML